MMLSAILGLAVAVVALVAVQETRAQHPYAYGYRYGYYQPSYSVPYPVPQRPLNGGFNSIAIGNQTFYNGTGDFSGLSGSALRLGNQTFYNGTGFHGNSMRIGNQTFSNFSYYGR
jgi:hypothetical protein